MQKVILTFVAYYLPGYKSGGPVRTIANMVELLGSELCFRIVTSDRDAGDTAPYSEVKAGEWNSVGKAQVYYAPPDMLRLRALAGLIRETPHDVLYLNSFFDPVFTLRPLLARRLGWLPQRPVVIAPRGEFSAGATELKRWKKAPYLTVMRKAGLFSGLTWQASSQQEFEDIRRVMRKISDRVLVAPDLPSRKSQEPVPESQREETDGVLKVVFLSRIDRMKNLDLALRVLERVKVPVIFNIYGPIWDQGYWGKCRKLIASLPDNVTATYKGSVLPEEVQRVLSAHDLFLLPTRGENFGHVILEALTAGTPVLISDLTPWTDDGAGGCTVIPLASEERFVQAIESFARSDPDRRSKARSAALAVADKFVCENRLLELNRQLFLGVTD